VDEDTRRMTNKGYRKYKNTKICPLFRIFPVTFNTALNTSVLMETHTAIVLFALVAAFGLVTVVAVDIILAAQEAEAVGCRTSTAVNASKGRCLK
jgi:hypothetical protein